MTQHAPEDHNAKTNLQVSVGYSMLLLFSEAEGTS